MIPTLLENLCLHCISYGVYAYEVVASWYYFHLFIFQYHGDSELHWTSTPNVSGCTVVLQPNE